MVVAVDGYMPGVVTEAVGSVRLRGLFAGPGGHAWGDRGNPSPMAALGWAITALYGLKKHEDMSVNVGRVWGGEAINAIPAEVGFELDLRASQAAMLEQLEAQAREVLMDAAQGQGVRLELEVLGRRPAGSTATPEMRRAARQALAEVGQQAHWLSGSTDASAAVEVGIPAVAFGAYRGGGAHTPEEWVEPESLLEGARALWGLVRGLRGL
jgi:acetylornithine deacetylase/succinyl-diaminopimelate desuccinylase-like protein